MIFKRMRDIREDKELRQKDIATILKVDRSTYTGWEIGKDTIPLRKLVALSNYYKISIDYITGLSNTNDYKYISKTDAKIVGKNLRELRISNNLKQKDLFKMLNTTSSTYSAYETGKVLIQTTFIYEIAKKYNCSIDGLLTK